MYYYLTIHYYFLLYMIFYLLIHILTHYIPGTVHFIHMKVSFSYIYSVFTNEKQQLSILCVMKSLKQLPDGASDATYDNSTK